MASRAATLAKAALSFDQERYDAERQRQLAERKLQAEHAAHLQTLIEEAPLELAGLASQGVLQCAQARRGSMWVLQLGPCGAARLSSSGTRR